MVYSFLITGTATDPTFANMSDNDVLETLMQNIKEMCENADFPIDSIHLSVSSSFDKILYGTWPKIENYDY